MADEKLNLYQKLAKIRKMAEYLRKNKTGHGYKYVSEDEILLKVTAGMEKHGVSLIPKIVHGSEHIERTQYTKIKEQVDKAGNVIRTENSADDFVFTAQMEMVWVNDECPDDTLTVPWVVIGQQTNASMSFGSGLTYSNRYFLLKFFQVATSEDDPDYYKERKAEVANEEEKAMVDAILGQIEMLVQEKVNPTNSAAVKKAILGAKIVMENGKPSNKYNLIKDVDTATMYLQTLQSAIDQSSKNKGE